MTQLLEIHEIRQVLLSGPVVITHTNQHSDDTGGESDAEGKESITEIIGMVLTGLH